MDGRLFRLAGEDADAIGREPPPRPSLPDDATDQDVEDLIWASSRPSTIRKFPINVVDLGLIYECTLERTDDGQRHVNIAMTLTAPGCGMGEVLVADVRDRLKLIPTIDQVNVALTF